MIKEVSNQITLCTQHNYKEESAISNFDVSVQIFKFRLQHFELSFC